MTTFFHFTARAHLPSILGAGTLLPSESNVGSPLLGPGQEHLGPDVVWLLDQPVLDANHGLYAEATGKDQVVFEVEVPAIRWLDWAPAADMDPQWREIFIRTGGGIEAAEHWYVFPAAIPRRRWVSARVVEDDETFINRA